MYVARAFNPATDFPALVELLNDAAKTDAGSSTTEAEQRGQTESLEQYGFFKQWVILASDDATKLIAYASSYQQNLMTPYTGFVITVHPDYRQDDLDTQLLDVIKRDAKQRQLSYISAFTVDNHDFQTFLLQQGFRQEGAFRLLTLDVTQLFPVPKIPSGFTLRTYEQVKDINLLTEITNTGLADLPGHGVATVESIEKLLETNPNDVTYLLFAANNKVIGSVGVTLRDTQGTVDSPAIVPEHRTPELYKYLVLLGLRDLTKRGCNQVQMYSWGDYDSTIAAYTELGFKTTIHELGYRLELA
jgi:N-acetylglutamate synthase-like GNAT family acetyltransferase